jgi:hypothetical protein
MASISPAPQVMATEISGGARAAVAAFVLSRHLPRL